MKHITLFTIVLIVNLLHSSCNNAAKTAPATADSSAKSDTSTNAMNDTVAIPSVTKIDNPAPPPPPQRFVEMQAIKIEEVEEEPPPYDMNARIDRIDPIDEPLGPANYDGPEIIESPDTKIFTVVEEKPEMYMLSEFLMENMNYPTGPREMGIQGVVNVEFVVDNNGRVKDVRTKKTSGNFELDKEAMRVIKKTSGKWKPGKVNGKAVNTQMTLPITFQIEE